MAATEVMGLVMDAMPKMESPLTSTLDARSRFPKAPEYVVLPAVQAMATAIGYPDAAEEVQLALHRGGTYALAELRAVCTPEEWRRAQQATESVPVRDAVAAYAVDLCRGSRTAPGVHVGASPRAAIRLLRAAQAHAVLAARAYVVPDDVKAVAVDCLAHRILTVEADGDATRSAAVIRELLETTPAPRP